MASNIRITFLGTGGSMPKPGRSLPAVAIQVDDILNLFDCGEGTQKQFMKSGVSFMSLSNIFISHFHADHFLGLPGLLNSLSFMGRTEDLNIFGPVGAVNFIRNAITLGYGRISYNINVVEVIPGTSYNLGKFTIRTLANNHTVPSISYSLEEKDLTKIDRKKVDEIGFPVYRLEELRKNGKVELNGKEYLLNDVAMGIKKGRKIVYTGDTRPVPEMPEFAKNADVLIHDTTMDSSMEPMVNEYGHSSARQAAESALKGGVKKLFLFHYSSRYNDLDILLKDAKKVFPESYLSHELEQYDIEKNDRLISIS
ncbi:ribonuclease Z [Ferroplasma acidiphilum]|nr:ribonuclease Z [Ferroplasma acidiphilum]MCL4349583.1 ribonuclease Z [Candidatus Thermoplasmatota archaeon]WMT53272.1 MAG: ribonuclease Z [Ferroplasma acidiphilum]